MKSLRIVRRAAFALAALFSVPAVFVAGSLFAATAAQAAPLSAIQVNGNVRIDTATIRSYVPVAIGQNFTQADLSETLAILFATGFFANVQVTASGTIIVITVVENPVVVEIRFVGNRKLRTPELIELVETEERSVLSEVVVAADIRRIEERYAQRGRGLAVIDVQIDRLEGNLAIVTFNITEGERVRIADINFEGNNAFTDRQLESVIVTRESSILTFISHADAYSPDGWARDVDLLRRHYLQNGYADFQVLSTDVRFDETTSAYTITVIVNEGPLYRLGAVGVDSTIPGVTQETLARAIHIRSGQVFNALDLERSLEEIAVALADAGQPFATVTPRANRNYQTNEIDIIFLIDPGPRVYIERIEIVGNTRTRDYVIRREFDVAEGDAFNAVLISRVERRLMALGLFQTVNIETRQGSAPDQAVVVVHVTERQTGEVSATGGYSTADGIIGEISLNETNFLGRGQHLRLAFTIGVNNRNYSISFTEPYFLGRRLPFGFDAYRRTTTASATRPFGETEFGGQVRIGLPLTETLTAQFSYRFVQETITGTTRPDVYPNGTTTTSSVGLTLVYNTIDNMGAPRSGVFARGVIEYAGLGGSNRFLRTTLDTRWYRPIGYQSPIVAMLRFQAGNIVGVGQGVRPMDNFLLGADTIRGFGAAGFGPRTTDGTGLALGGTTYWAATAEVTFPLPLVPEDFGLRGGVFADAGMLFGVNPLAGPPPFPTFVTDTALRASAGVSLLWDSPIGVLRFDYALWTRSQAYDVLQAFRFSAGATF